MRFFYLDPGLQNDVGHHANYCRYIVGELRARGVETLVFAALRVKSALLSELGAIPHFRVRTYVESDGDPVCGWLTGFETFDILGIGPGLKLRQELTVKATADDGKMTEFKVICRIDTPAEMDYYRHGGILEYVLRQLLAS